MERPISDLLAALAKGEKVEDQIYEYYYQLAWEAAQKWIAKPFQSLVSPSDIANMSLKSALSEAAKGKVHGSEHFKSLVLSIARKKTASEIRRATAHKRSTHRLDTQTDVANLPSTKEPAPEEVAIANELQKLVEKLLPDEDPLDAAIGYLSFMEGYSVQQIYDWLVEQSKKTGSKVIMPGAIRLRLQRIRERLEKFLGEQE
jgi:DNA-directed RNA polymerase specialized sigma24 family protein